jgi:hypothetical protein
MTGVGGDEILRFAQNDKKGGENDGWADAGAHPYRRKAQRKGCIEKRKPSHIEREGVARDILVSIYDAAGAFWIFSRADA